MPQCRRASTEQGFPAGLRDAEPVVAGTVERDEAAELGGVRPARSMEGRATRATDAGPCGRSATARHAKQAARPKRSKSGTTRERHWRRARRQPRAEMATSFLYRGVRPVASSI